MSVLSNTGILAGASGAAAGGGGGEPIEVANSLRFNSGDSAYLNRTPSSTGNQKTWTYSCWVKFSLSSVEYQNIFGVSESTGTWTNLYTYNYSGSRTIRFGDYYWTDFRYQVTDVEFRDPSAWYHIVFAFDSTNSTAADRQIMWINGVRLTPTTNTCTLDEPSPINSTNEHNIFREKLIGSGLYADGYLAEVNFCDGSALDASSFGMTHETTGQWVPIEYTGSYGTNGFRLKFDNTSDLGEDSSGNDNDWTANYFSTTAGADNDVLADSPSTYDDGGNGVGNYATWSPSVAQRNGSMELSNGNLDTSCGSTRTTAMSDWALTGKTYWEVTFGSGTYNYIGMTEATGFNTVANSNSGIKYTGYQSYSYGWGQGDGKLYKASNILSSSPGTYSNGDVMGWAYDADNNVLKLYKNGSLEHTENNIADAQYFPAITHSANGATSSANFGQRAFNNLPTGYLALNTFNLDDPTIADPTDHFKVVTYDGTGATQTISCGFQPDLVWIKDLTQDHNHNLLDSVRGAPNIVSSDSDAVEITNSTDGLTAFTSDGFTLGANSAGTQSDELNKSGNDYVSYCWKAGGAATTVNAGDYGGGVPTLATEVTANTTAGFSVVKYSDSNGVQSVAHGLSKKVDFIMLKNLGTVVNWSVFHSSLIVPNHALYLNTSAAVFNSSRWNSSQGTDEVFYWNDNTSTDDHIAYCWTSVESYSKFGLYEGNNSTDGTYVHLGFHPAFIMIKNIDATADWTIYDTARDTYNASSAELYPNTDGAEFGSGPIDILSNGFKQRSQHTHLNQAYTYIYCAWAETPFKYSNAK